MIRLQRAQTFPIRGAFNGAILKDWLLMFQAGGSHFDVPSFDMISAARVYLHIIPIVAREILHCRLGQTMCTPFTLKIVSPHAGGYAVYSLTAQRGIYSFFLIHYFSPRENGLCS